MDSVLYKAWRVNAVVTVVQLLIGLAAYLQWNLVIAAATVGFFTLCSILPFVEDKCLKFCPKIENIVGMNTLAAFFVAFVALAANFPANSHLTADYIAIISVMCWLLSVMVIAALYSVAVFTVLDYRTTEKVPEPSLVIAACLLPAGIGIVFGAVYKLVTRLQQALIVRKREKDDPSIDPPIF